MDRHQEGLWRNYLLRFECRRKRQRRASILQTAETVLWNSFLMVVAACVALWAIIGLQQLAYMERGCDAIGGEYILIGLAVIGIVKVANRWRK